jgi:hypothetical protein
MEDVQLHTVNTKPIITELITYNYLNKKRSKGEHQSK